MPQIPLFTWDAPARGSDLLSATVRNSLNAIGSLNYTTDANYPLTKRTGMPRIKADDLTNIQLQWWTGAAWVTIVEHLENYFPLTKRQEVPFLVAANPWTINHGFSQKPLIQCFDAGNNMVVPVNIQHVLVAGNWSRTIVTHGAALAGYAILIG